MLLLSAHLMWVFFILSFGYGLSVLNFQNFFILLFAWIVFIVSLFQSFSEVKERLALLCCLVSLFRCLKPVCDETIPQFLK